MAENKSSISKAESYAEIGEYWDAHDLAEQWDETRAVSFDVTIDSSVTYFAVENALAAKIRDVAKHHGVSPEALLVSWLQEHVAAEHPAK